jgi:soluble epoxide hydrolase/lipid-phosphate phosphatase
MVPLAPYISASDKVHHHAIFGDDYSPPCKWYVRGLRNLGVEEEKKALREGRISGGLKGDVLMITGLKDAVCLADWARVSISRSVEGGGKGGKLKVVDVDASHVSASFPFLWFCDGLRKL